MITWTAAAKAELDQYFQRIRPGLAASGADAEEVIADLKNHLETEAGAMRLSVITGEDVKRLLARIGAPEDPQPSPPPAAAASPASAPHVPWRGFGSVLLLLFGVLLPLLTLGLELATHMCAAAFFDPLPSWWHVALVAFVPLANGWAWLAVRRGNADRRALLGWLNGAAIAVGLFFAFMFLPLLLPGAIAILFFGWGLLPWSPMLALISAVVLRRKLRAMTNVPLALPGLWRGFALGLLALVLVEAPVTLTRLGERWAISDSPSLERAGLRLLRMFGREEQLLRDCYGYTRGAQEMDLLGSLVAGSERVQPEKAREIYYRVTGESFNVRPAPTVRTGRGAFADLNAWTWDSDHGGDKVGGRLKGLSLISSRLDTIVDPAAAWSYTEWTMEFRNDSPQDREARAQLLLPPGGVVSRLTLWVNGEEREAAFAGRGKVREAYEKVAVQQRRDPVLVTTAGPDRVLMQCFPVPRNGGTMKVRLGITAPLALVSLGEGAVRLPSLVERNFSVREGVTHSVWADGGELKSASPKFSATVNTAGKPALRGQLDNADLASPECLLRVKRDPAQRFAWTADPRAGEGKFVRQQISEQPEAAPTALVVVVDGSRAMQALLPRIAEALKRWPAAKPLTVLVAGDDIAQLGGTNRSEGTDALAALAAWRAVGGQDNVPALLRAQEIAGRTPGAALLWLHAPQPVLFHAVDPLLQAWQRQAKGPALHEFQLLPGPDRVMEKLDGVTAVQGVPRFGAWEADLTRLLGSWQGNHPVPRIERAQLETEAAARADGAVPGTLHIARLWAMDEARRLAGRRKVAEAADVAARHQLVTPVSGAVVLETQQQYQQAGLQPVEPDSVPSIPEPSTAAILMLGGALLWMGRKRRPSPI